MSIMTSVWVICDACDIDSAADYGARNVADARADAKDRGWHRAKGRDICADCWKEGVRTVRAAPATTEGDTTLVLELLGGERLSWGTGQPETANQP